MKTIKLTEPQLAVVLKGLLMVEADLADRELEGEAVAKLQQLLGRVFRAFGWNG